MRPASVSAAATNTSSSYAGAILRAAASWARGEEEKEEEEEAREDNEGLNLEEVLQAIQEEEAKGAKSKEQPRQVSGGRLSSRPVDLGRWRRNDGGNVQSRRRRKWSLDTTTSTECYGRDNEEEEDDVDLPEISLREVSAHAWMVVYDKVYDVTDFLSEHPGGEEVMREYVGYDASVAFRGVGHSPDALEMLDRYLVGVLPEEERMFRSFGESFSW